MREMESFHILARVYRLSKNNNYIGFLILIDPSDLCAAPPALLSTVYPAYVHVRNDVNRLSFTAFLLFRL